MPPLSWPPYYATTQTPHGTSAAWLTNGPPTRAYAKPYVRVLTHEGTNTCKAHATVLDHPLHLCLTALHVRQGQRATGRQPSETPRSGVMTAGAG